MSAYYILYKQAKVLSLFLWTRPWLALEYKAKWPFYTFKNTYIASISLTVRDRAISSKFSSLRVSNAYTIPTLGKFFKSGGHFEFLPKVAKHKIASISLTIRDRTISSKFPTPRVSKHYTISTFGKFFKNRGHFKLSSSKMLKKYFGEEKRNSQQYSFIAML